MHSKPLLSKHAELVKARQFEQIYRNLCKEWSLLRVLRIDILIINKGVLSEVLSKLEFRNADKPNLR